MSANPVFHNVPVRWVHLDLSYHEARNNTHNNAYKALRGAYRSTMLLAAKPHTRPLHTRRAKH